MTPGLHRFKPQTGSVTGIALLIHARRAVVAIDLFEASLVGGPLVIEKIEPQFHKITLKSTGKRRQRIGSSDGPVRCAVQSLAFRSLVDFDFRDIAILRHADVDDTVALLALRRAGGIWHHKDPAGSHDSNDLLEVWLNVEALRVGEDVIPRSSMPDGSAGDSSALTLGYRAGN